MKIYLNQVKRLFNQLTAKNVIIPEKVIFAWVLNNLSPNYETLITTITQSIRVNSSDSIKLEELFSNLIDESKRLKHKDSGETALVTTVRTHLTGYERCVPARLAREVRPKGLTGE